MDSLAITDHGALYGAIEFYTECHEAGIKPIIGCETYMAQESRHSRTPADKTKGPVQGSGKDSGEKPKKAEKRDAPPAQAKPDHGPSTQAKGPDKGPVKGLGDHMPAFLMTAPPKSNSK